MLRISIVFIFSTLKALTRSCEYSERTKQQLKCCLISLFEKHNKNVQSMWNIMHEFCGIDWQCLTYSAKTHVSFFFRLLGCDGVEYWSSEHYFGHGRERKWGHNKRSKHSVSLFRDVEEHVCLAHRGHGSLQHQLPSLRRTQVLVQSQHV